MQCCSCSVFTRGGVSVPVQREGAPPAESPRAQLFLRSRRTRAAPPGSGTAPGGQCTPLPAPSSERGPEPAAEGGDPARAEAKPSPGLPAHRDRGGLSLRPAGPPAPHLSPAGLQLAAPRLLLRLHGAAGRSGPPAPSGRRWPSSGHGRPGPLPARRRAGHTARGGAPRPLATTPDAPRPPANGDSVPQPGSAHPR